MALRRQLARAAVVLYAATLASGCGATTSPERTGPAEPASAEKPGGVPFRVYTHCGVESLRVAGRWWHAKPPLYDDHRTGPPPGWADPYQEGTLTLESPDRAVFEALGERVVFVPAQDNAPVRICR